jgi:acyl-CoA oxidase
MPRHRRLPNRAGSKPVDHALTYFDHVKLPSTALLGTCDKPKNEREHFMKVIWRVPIGALALSTVTVPALKIATFVAGKYSLRRTVTDHNGELIPIMAFRTQQMPIIKALTQVAILDAFANVPGQKSRHQSATWNIHHFEICHDESRAEEPLLTSGTMWCPGLIPV